MKIEKNILIDGVYTITPEVHGDDRGEFFRLFCKQEIGQISSSEFVQMNYSKNYLKGTLRGLHYQKPPFEEEKIVTCISGKIQDVFVDLRSESKTFLKYSSIILDSKLPQLIFLPKGIAHGFLTLEDNTQILYQHSNYYQPNAEAGIKFDDPLININWVTQPVIISERDQNHPLLTTNFKGIKNEL